MRATTKLAIRAAIAISLAEIITQSLGFTKGYWGVMTILIIIGASLGESISKGYQRLSMIIFGSICGGLVIYIFGSAHFLLYSTLLIVGSFLTFFLISYTYSRGIFFLTFTVMILYQLLGEWTLYTIMERIGETILAFVIVIIVSKYIFPESISKKMKQSFLETLHLTMNYRKHITNKVLFLQKSRNENFEWESLAYGKKLVANLYTIFFSLKFEHFFHKNIKKAVKKSIKCFSDILYEMEEIENILRNKEILEITKEEVVKYFVLFKLKQEIIEKIFEKPLETQYIKSNYIKIMKEKNNINSKGIDNFLNSNNYTNDDKICITEIFYYLNRANKNFSSLIALTCMIEKNKKLST